MIGLGTIINVIAILIGSAIGVALGHRLPQRTRDVVTDGVGLAVLLVAALSAAAVLSPAVSEDVGASGVLIVLGSLLIGGILGSLWRIEARLEGLGESIRLRLSRRSSMAQSPARREGRSAEAPVDPDSSQRAAGPRTRPRRRTPTTPPRRATRWTWRSTGPWRMPTAMDGTAQPNTFVEGFVTASLVFCVGPLAILGSLSDGLGLGINQLALKSVMDGFTSIAFAASLGWGVAASALVVGVYQGTLTLLGWGLGSVLSAAQIALLTATGGLLLVGIALRLLRIRQVPVGDLLPALLVAPILTGIVAALR